ncbi:set domain-containing protein [Cyclospora cayetanensis]|uniref:Set domain-containing protein n=1 Tax=Cyclospora cayetanensis TaxID=88456 RepID=A0A1D3CX74_9EIME|nr:set domain-containing protein [Cyclospora cayetanensis]
MPLVEYAGEVYIHPKTKRYPPPQLAEIREARYDWQHGNCYCFAVEETLCTRYVDATDMGNLARYINHCCEPNAESVLLGDSVVGISALRDIVSGEEVFYDYQLPNTRSEEQGDYMAACEHPKKCPRWHQQHGIHFTKFFLTETFFKKVTTTQHSGEAPVMKEETRQQADRH